MKTLQLLQIGDIHYPQASMEHMADHKDTGIPNGFVAKIAPEPLRVVGRKLAGLIQDLRPSAVMLCGDLTSFGDLENYQQCARYLVGLLGRPDSEEIDPNGIHVVPGNHDVDMDTVTGDEEDLSYKFTPLVDSWSELNLPIFPSPKFREARVQSDGAEACVFSLNSCIGCGEKRYLPETVRDELFDIFARHTEQMLNVSALDDEVRLRVREQLDTPAFIAEDIETVCTAINKLGDDILPVVLAHHNLLPQAVLRVAIYTELLNGGLARSSLMQCAHPVLYLHGHIHDDPIEILRGPTRGRGPLISISAPRLVNGFNLIRIEYGSRGVPLGCVVTPYVQKRGGVVPGDEKRLSLQDASEAERLGDERIAKILPCLSRERKYFNNVRNKVNENRERKMRHETLVNLLREAEWFGLVELENRDGNAELIQARRVSP